MKGVPLLNFIIVYASLRQVIMTANVFAFKPLSTKKI